MLRCMQIYLKGIQEHRKKQWPQLKRAREEGKIAYFSQTNYLLRDILLLHNVFFCLYFIGGS